MVFFPFIEQICAFKNKCKKYLYYNIFRTHTQQLQIFVIERCFASGGIGWRRESEWCSVLIHKAVYALPFELVVCSLGLLLPLKSVHCLNLVLAWFLLQTRLHDLSCFHASVLSLIIFKMFVSVYVAVE